MTYQSSAAVAAHDAGAAEDRGRISAPELSEVVTEVGALRERLATLEANIPAAVAGQPATCRRSLAPKPKIIALVLSSAALAGASIVYGPSAGGGLFIGQKGKVRVRTDKPASRLP